MSIGGLHIFGGLGALAAAAVTATIFMQAGQIRELSESVTGLTAAAALRAECDRALREGELFAARIVCPADVKTLMAERDALLVRAEAAEILLGAQRADDDDAIRRAEARGREEERRRRHADEVIRDAPRDDGGLVRFDAERLRQLRRPPAGD